MSVRVLTVNPGSNSLRLDLVDVAERAPEVVDSEHTGTQALGDESLDAFDRFLDRHAADVAGVSHRVVHGGEQLQEPQQVSDEALSRLRAVEPLDPQHLAATIHLVQRAGQSRPGLRQVLCPDTGFHRTLPEEARREPLPARWRKHVRRFGFHGVSYAWTLSRTSELLDRPAEQTNALIAHLGGGCSACAVHGGQSVATTMGFTPMGGMTMSRRSGELDPGLLFWLLNNTGESWEDVQRSLQRESGLFGLSDGRSGDTRELVEAAAGGDDEARLALRVFCRSVAGGIAAMATSLPTVDALVFTGEIGWNQPEVRRDVCQRLSLLGIPARLAGHRHEDGPVSPPGEEPPVLIVQPREELQLAVEAAAVLS